MASRCGFACVSLLTAGLICWAIGALPPVALAADAAGAAAASAPTGSTLGQPVFSWGNYVQALAILCLLLGVLWLGVWLLRRYGRFNFIPRPGSLPRDALIMEAQMPLGPRKGLMVVRFMDRRLLLGVTEQQISLLTEESADHETLCQDFQRILEQSAAGAADGAAADGSRA
ncbi:flagellar biosynthetic protein FliO [uncultured Desulfovibrio sp.]|uniref:Flagellar protein n=1 Tax=Candidatus Desulfovibrio intestinavium TaxID=2838534 RepID=A0A9D2HMS0_9BACT|nr:flagellar biosynthetic protein FliO [uncultured Desulfovibrio sp.]HJA79836.1 flagellar biosynthetic protein FliO [Candidatus Desulfovibrio intestinavium]